jgi:hypothetical protein
MLYQKYETDISQENLFKVFAKVPEPKCLLGGWAVYLTVNKSFKQTHMRDYHGSKDIDIGFHIERSDLELVKESTFARSIKTLEEIGFSPISQRFVKFYHTETRKELTENESKHFPQPFIFCLFVDPIVDRIPANIVELLGFVPIDEPLLSAVFQGKKYTIIKEFGTKLILPDPEVLLATKIVTVHNRTNDHKKIKDICDIYALIWHSNVSQGKLHQSLSHLINTKGISTTFSKFTADDYKQASNALGVDSLEFSNVMKSFNRA